jgi:ABC-type Fe3+-hydroxamate transport system substrate-binding protein
VPDGGAPARVVSLVPSLTETVAELGLADRLVGVTRYCERGAPQSAVRIGGTKNPDVDAVAALRPSIVLANTEENRPEDLDALRAAGCTVLETFPRTVSDVAPMLVELGAALGVAEQGRTMAAQVDSARERAAARRPRTPLAACTLIWRKPWMAVGPDTFVDDLLGVCGFANVLAGADERYPRLDPDLLLRPQVVLLPSEPYAFSEKDSEAVAGLLGDVPQRYVDGQLLTWHGQRTAAALEVFTDLAVELSALVQR